jgi:RNA polymerase sigma factor (sigma-70 family)
MRGTRVTPGGSGGIDRAMGRLSTGVRAVRSDAELIVASREDPRAFRELYDRWAEPLLAYFMRRVLNAEIAADLLAETFAAAYEHRGRFRDVGRPGGAWLYGIAAKKLAHYFRRREVEMRTARRLGLARPALDQESAGLIAALIDDDEHRSALRAALEQISGAEREAVELRVISELDYDQIAERLCCTPAAARTRVHRGLARLSKLMEAPS